MSDPSQNTHISYFVDQVLADLDALSNPNPKDQTPMTEIALNSISLVEEFHRTFDQPVLDAPNLSNAEVNALRVKLIQEELDELREALTECDPVAALDALTDLQYVLDGSYLSLGLHRWKDAALAEVHRSNMSKTGADGVPLKNAGGKILKGPNYTPPDLTSILKQ